MRLDSLKPQAQGHRKPRARRQLIDRLPRAQDKRHCPFARGNELRAQTDLKAIAELQRVTGNSLTANNVTVAVR